MNPDKVIGLITARGGSKGLPRKNVLSAGGKPLVAWTVEAALAARSVGSIVISTDDDEIMGAAKLAGCNMSLRRPPELSGDTASSIDVVLHAIDQLPDFEYVVLLQPTSPLRTSDDIDSAFELMLKSSAPSCVSACEADQSPYWMYRVEANSKLKRLLPEMEGITRRQDLPPIYVLNGAIYIAQIDWLRANRGFVGKETVAYLMPKERSLDIDTAQDFEIFRSRIESEKYPLAENEQGKF